MSEELKTCPFCERKAVKGLGKKNHCQMHGEPYQAVSIKCTNRDCKVKPYVEAGDVFNEGKELALKEVTQIWNNRPIEQELEARVKELEAFDELLGWNLKQAVEILEKSEQEITALKVELNSKDWKKRIEVLRSDRDRVTKENVQLHRELEELKKANAWQPIETAPKDGTTIILGFLKHGAVRTGYFHTQANGYVLLVLNKNYWSKPDYWQPLPTLLEENNNG